MNRYRTRQVSSTSSSSTSESSNWTHSHLDHLDQDFWIEDPPFRPQGEDPLVNNLVDNMANQVNLGHEEQGAAGEAPPPYPGPGNPQPNGQMGAAELLGLVQNLITAQQNQHQQQIEADARFNHAHQELGQQIENLTAAIGAGGGGRPHHGGAQSFKPSMFRALDMKATNKENKLLSEEFVNWTLSIKRVLQANPGVAALPIQRLTALILAGNHCPHTVVSLMNIHTSRA